jgi:hypothetical protein
VMDAPSFVASRAIVPCAFYSAGTGRSMLAPPVKAASSMSKCSRINPSDSRSSTTLGAVNYSGDHGAWGWMVSPRANISTNWPMRLERVSGFLAFPIL